MEVTPPVTVIPAGDRGEGVESLMKDKDDMRLEEKSDLERYKQKYQSVQDAVRQLEYASLRCESVESLFGSELMSRRNKVKDLCEKSLFEAPKTLVPVIREKLWRAVFYDVFGRAKRVKKGQPWTATQLVYIRNHLLNGIGQLSILLMKFQELPEFKESGFRLCANGVENILPRSLQDTNTGGKQPEKWLIDLLYACLVNIGDLHRYLTEIYSQGGDEEDMHMKFYDRAQDYYSQAFLLNPDSGIAHNQLGNLSIKLNGGLDATYYLLYSLVSPNPYEGAYSNLRQLLDRQLVHFATLPAAVECKTMDVFTHHFLSMIYHFLCEGPHLNNFEKSCQDAILGFIHLLYDKTAVYDDGFIFRISLISIMTVWRLQSVGSPNVSAAVAFAIGIFIQLIEKLVIILKEHSHLEPQKPFLKEELEEAHIEDTMTVTLTKSVTPPSNDDVEKGESKEIVSKRKIKRKSSGPARRRRPLPAASNGLLGFSSSEEDDDSDDDESSDGGRRRRLNGDDESGNSSSDDSSETDMSDSECELWSSGITDSEDETQTSGQEVNGSNKGYGDSSEVSDTSYQAEIERKVAELKLSQGSDDISTKGKDGDDDEAVEELMKPVMDQNELRQCWNEVEPVLVATLPFMRWLQATPTVQNAFAQNCEKSVLDKFCQVLNLFGSTNWATVFEFDEYQYDNGLNKLDTSRDYHSLSKQFQEDWQVLRKGRIGNTKIFSYELPEDKSLLGLPVFRDELAGLECKSLLSDQSMVMIRIARIIKFGHWIVETDEFAIIHSDGEFIVPSVEGFKRHMQNRLPGKYQNALTTRKTMESKMLGKLFLDSKSNVPKRNRGRNNGNNRGENFRSMHFNEDEKVYIFVDLPAVLNYLKVLRNLARHPKFIVVLPFSVNHALDGLKETEKEGSKEARAAARWLDGCSGAGSKGFNQVVRISQQHEKTVLTNATYPKVHTTQSWEFFDVLESCNYLRNKDLKSLKRPSYEFFRDIRDKYRIFYLTGHVDLTNSDSDRGYNPVEAARAASVFLDRIPRYEGRVGRRKRIRRKKYCG